MRKSLSAVNTRRPNVSGLGQDNEFALGADKRSISLGCSPRHTDRARNRGRVPDLRATAYSDEVCRARTAGRPKTSIPSHIRIYTEEPNRRPSLLR